MGVAGVQGLVIDSYPSIELDFPIFPNFIPELFLQ